MDNYVVNKLNEEIQKLTGNTKYYAVDSTCKPDIIIYYKINSIKLIVGYFYGDARLGQIGQLVFFADKFRHLHHRTEKYIHSIEDSIDKLGIKESYSDSSSIPKVLKVTLSDIQIYDDAIYEAGIKYLDNMLKVFAENKLDLQIFYALYPRVNGLFVSIVKYDDTKFAVQDKETITVYNLDSLQIVSSNTELYNNVVAKYHFSEDLKNKGV